MTPPTDRIPFALEVGQRRVVDRLCAAVRAAGEELGEIAKRSASRATPGPVSSLKSPRHANVFGVLGGRGSGKTTLMIEAMWELATAGGAGIQVLRPIDCSTSPPNLLLSATVLYGLNQRVEELLVARDPCRADRCTEEQRRKEFEKVIHSFFKGSAAAGTVVVQQSNGPDAYARNATAQVRDRCGHREDLERWLERRANELDVGVFVLPLDDVDLSPSLQEHHLVWSLLDEFHQSRLILVLAADLVRFEAHVHEGQGGLRLDAATAAEVVYKVMPEERRFHAPRWTDPLEYRHPAPALAPLETIGDLLARATLPDAIAEHLPALLPDHPRGLENVWRQLATFDPDNVPVADLLATLAEARGDRHLSRKMRGRPLEPWVWDLAWPVDALAEAPWRSLALRAAGGGRVDELLAVGGLFDGAVGRDDARWAELLLDHALGLRILSPAAFVARFVPLRARLSDSAFEVRIDEIALDRYFRSPSASARAELHWIRFEELDRTTRHARLRVGHAPMAQVAAGERALYPDRLLERLQRSAARIEAASRSTGSSVGGALPDRARGIVLFAAALEEADWGALSRAALARPLGVLARLAAGITRSAWARALELALKAGRKPGALAWSDDDRALHDTFLGPSASGGALFTLDEPTLQARLNGAATGLPPLPAGASATAIALHRGLQAFQAHSAWRDLLT